MKKKIINLTFSILISILFLYLSFKNVKINEIKKCFINFKIIWLIPFFILNFLSYIFKSIRWKILLSKIKIINFKDIFSITMISFMMLFLLPFRLGDVVRCFLLRKKEGIPVSAGVSSVVAERIFDGCSVFLLFLLSLAIYPEPINFSIGKYNYDFKTSVYIITSIYIIAMIVLFLLHKNYIFGIKIIKKILFFLPEKIMIKIENIIHTFIQGLESITNLKKFFLVSFYSVLSWTLVAASYYFVLFGFDISKSFYLSYIILGCSVIGVMIPAAPGFLGTFQYSIQLSFLYFLHLPKSLALTYAWILWLGTAIVIIISGIIFFIKENLSLNIVKTNLEEEQ